MGATAHHHTPITHFKPLSHGLHTYLWWSLQCRNHIIDCSDPALRRPNVSYIIQHANQDTCSELTTRSGNSRPTGAATTQSCCWLFLKSSAAWSIWSLARSHLPKHILRSTDRITVILSLSVTVSHCHYHSFSVTIILQLVSLSCSLSVTIILSLVSLAFSYLYH